MWEAWLVESAKGIGRLFLTPLLYWAVLLVLLAGAKRIKSERLDFGIKIYDLFSEWKHTLLPAVLMGLALSAFTVGVGVVLTVPAILLLSIITILVSMNGKFSFLSASYTLGITYLFLLFLPELAKQLPFLQSEWIGDINLSGLVSLLALLLFAESLLLFRARNDISYPELSLGHRGGWIGQHRLKKMTVLPFFTLLPTGSITSFADYWPYFTIGGEEYSLILIPFVLGFEQVVRGQDPKIAAVKIARSTLLLSILVGLFACLSIYYSWASLIGVVVAVVGRELINYLHRMKDEAKSGFFQSTDQALKILVVLPNSPADRMEIEAGEWITKVNGRKVNSMAQFYEALQTNGAFFKLEVINKAGEVRILQGAWYEGDHHGLGILCTSTPHYKEKHNIV
ncbi:PDZ domain-containing protein [Virgibacillus proomii]|uniref:PDZ domain-containing protein n=1 Tax=Virgibacillus proomii TaxID=84407 RepID=UPI0009863241|nr:PDZ domain-containing protein [Virgibacillus proomii]